MRIGDLAIQAGVTTKTIRCYESLGLLDPPQRTSAGYRDYDTTASDRLQFIRDAQATGLSLTEIQSILDMKDAGAGTCEHTKALLENHLCELDRQIERLLATKATLLDLHARVAELDPADCNEPSRCQVIAALDPHVVSDRPRRRSPVGR